MKNCQISIILPGIRINNWKRLYDSIFHSTKYCFELIIISPHNLPEELKNKENIIWSQDFGNPVRCQNIAASLASGEFITWTSDDGIFVENSLQEAIEYLKLVDDEKNVCVFNYMEANNLVQDSHLRLVNAYPKAIYIDPEWIIFNVAVMNTDYFKELGGFDCEFESTAVRSCRSGLSCPER